MRIALVINSLGVGGAERVLATLASYWAGAGHTVTLITFDRESDAVRQPLDPRVIPKRLGVSTAKHSPLGKLLRAPLLVWRLRNAIQGCNPERVISFMDQGNILTLLALWGSTTPVVVSERCDPARSSLMELPLPKKILQLINRFRIWIYHRASTVVLQTERSREFFPASLQSKISVIPNPVPPYTGGREPDLAAQVVVGLGRLVPQKRFDILIDSFKQVAEKFPEWKLLIFGHGPEKDVLNAKIAELQLSDRVLLPGPVLHPDDALCHGSIFVLSSESEGFPGALCDAMAFGLPVIATSCRYGPEEILSDERDGFLVPVNDPKWLSHALTRLMEDPARRAAMALEAKRITERFPLTTIAQRWLGIEPIVTQQLKPPAPPPVTEMH